VPPLRLAGSLGLDFCSLARSAQRAAGKLWREQLAARTLRAQPAHPQTQHSLARSLASRACFLSIRGAQIKPLIMSENRRQVARAGRQVMYYSFAVRTGAATRFGSICSRRLRRQGRTNPGAAIRAGRDLRPKVGDESPSIGGARKLAKPASQSPQLMPTSLTTFGCGADKPPKWTGRVTGGVVFKNRPPPPPIRPQSWTQAGRRLELAASMAGAAIELP